LLSFRQANTQTFFTTLRDYPTATSESSNAPSEQQASAAAMSARLREKKWGSNVFVRLDDDRPRPEPIDRLTTATPDWALVTKYQAALHDEELMTSARKKKAAISSTKEALAVCECMC
jgi:hypothetical protein